MKKVFNNKGFTLFELLAVLAILAIVAGIAVPRVMQTISNARVQALETEMELVASSVQRMLVEEELASPGNSGGVDVPFYIAGVNVSSNTGIVYDYTEYTDETFDEIATNLSIDDYLEGGVPDYLTVLVVDETAIDDIDGTKDISESKTGAIVVIYDETYVSHSNITKSDLELENEYSLGEEGNVIVKTFNYSGTN